MSGLKPFSDEPEKQGPGGGEPGAGARSVDGVPAGSPVFVTTRWSVVLAAGNPSDPGRNKALETFCSTYWYPLYAFTRRQGFDADASQDLVQSFFARLLERNDLEGVSPTGARFRSYLLKALTHFLINERQRAGALKRGGGQVHVSMDVDADAVEGRYLNELEMKLADFETPDRAFDRQWALALLESAMGVLEGEQVRAGKGNSWKRLRTFLSRDPEAGEYERVASELGMSVGTLVVTVHRLRQRYRDRVREAVAATVESPMEVDDEMRHLLEVIRGRG